MTFPQSSLCAEAHRARNRTTAPSPRGAGHRSTSAYEIPASRSKLLPSLGPLVRSSGPAQRTRGNLGDSHRARLTATLSQTGDLFDHLALCFMTRRDLHDGRACRRDGEPYGLSVSLFRSIQERQIDVITMAATRETDTGNIEDRLALPEAQVGLPPGKRWQVWGDPVKLPHMLVTARRLLIGLNCSHVKNWGANSSLALSFIKKPSALVMKGFMVATMNPFSWDVVLRSTLSDQRRGQVPADGRSDH